MLRLTPSLPRSVGLGPVFFPAQRGLGLGPVSAQPAPVDPFQLVVLRQTGFPELPEHPSLHPFLEPVMGGGPWADPRGIQGLPLAPGTQDEKYSLHAVPVRPPGTTTAKAMGVLVFGNQGFHLLPELIRKTE